MQELHHRAVPLPQAFAPPFSSMDQRLEAWGGAGDSSHEEEKLIEDQMAIGSATPPKTAADKLRFFSIALVLVSDGRSC